MPREHGGRLDLRQQVGVVDGLGEGHEVSDDLRILELLYRPLHTWPQAMVEIGCHGSIASSGEPVHHGADKRIDTPPVLDYYNGGKRTRATGHGDVQSHILVADLDTFRKRWHAHSSPVTFAPAASHSSGRRRPLAWSLHRLYSYGWSLMACKAGMTSLPSSSMDRMTSLWALSPSLP